MLDDKKLFILGYSGHAYVVLDTAISLGITPIGYFNPERVSSDPYQLDYCGYEMDVDIKEIVKGELVFPALGSNSIRKKLMTIPKLTDLDFAKLIAPSAVISGLAKIDTGTFIAPSVVVQSNAQIGKGVIINTGAIVEHECNIANFVHVAPGAVLAGNVRVGEGAFIGANATVKEGTTVGEGAIIGAGAVVIRDIPPNETWVGNPAKRMTGEK